MGTGIRWKDTTCVLLGKNRQRRAWWATYAAGWGLRTVLESDTAEVPPFVADLVIAEHPVLGVPLWEVKAAWERAGKATDVTVWIAVVRTATEAMVTAAADKGVQSCLVEPGEQDLYVKVLEELARVADLRAVHALWRRGAYEVALAVAAAAYNTSGSTRSAWCAMESARHLGLPETEAWSEILKVRNNPKGWAGHAEYLLDQGKPEEAIAQLETVLMRAPRYLKAQDLLARAYAKLGALEEACTVVEAAAAAAPVTGSRWATLGNMRAQQGDWASAGAALGKVANLEDSEQALLGKALWEGGDVDAAVHAWRQIVDPALLALIQATQLLRSGVVAEAKQAWKRSTQTLTNWPAGPLESWRLRLGIALGCPEAALFIMKHHVLLAGEKNPWWETEALWLREHPDGSVMWGQAERELRIIIKQNNEAVRLASDGKYEQAALALDQVAKNWPENTTFQMNACKAWTAVARRSAHAGAKKKVTAYRSELEPYSEDPRVRAVLAETSDIGES